MEKGYDRVVAVSTSLLQDVPTPTDQVPFLVVPHTQCPRPAVAPLFLTQTAISTSRQPEGTGGFHGQPQPWCRAAQVDEEGGGGWCW